MIPKDAVASASAPTTMPIQSIRPLSAVRGLGHEEQRHEEGHGTEEQVEPEDGAPTPQPDEHAADDGTEGQGEAGDGGPDPEGVGPGATVGVDVADDGEGPGLRGGGAEAHDDATGDEQVDVGGQAATTEPAQKTATPASMTFLRPRMSPRVPPANMKAAKVSA